MNDILNKQRVSSADELYRGEWKKFIAFCYLKYIIHKFIP